MFETYRLVCNMDRRNNTRQYILEKAIETIYENGFQATSIDKILNNTEVTKGAFYYHFKSKEEMGLAVINEIIASSLAENLIEPLSRGKATTETIYLTFENFMLNSTEVEIRYGCIMNNLIQEMAPINQMFADALFTLIEKWTNEMTRVLKEAQSNGNFPKEIDAKETAAFVITSYEGARNLGKLYNSMDYYHLFLKQLKFYLRNENNS